MIKKWIYRMICLYDYYIVGGYKPPQVEYHVYSGYWDYLYKNTRSPYVYKVGQRFLS